MKRNVVMGNLVAFNRFKLSNHIKSSEISLAAYYALMRPERSQDTLKLNHQQVCLGFQKSFCNLVHPIYDGKIS